jgi:hypothetical protein
LALVSKPPLAVRHGSDSTTGKPDRLSLKLFTELCGTPKANLSRRARNPLPGGRDGRGEEMGLDAAM